MMFTDFQVQNMSRQLLLIHFGFFHSQFEIISLMFCSTFHKQDGGTALTVASQYGHSMVVDILLKNGANVHERLNVRSTSKGLFLSPHYQSITLHGLVLSLLFCKKPDG
ncbi:hypothetical protein ILYODFUR_038771 [Ilyodon furcidens]|uniref:Ankyrin repeat domain-containing protein 29 n=1 Tax=Ilyodon furcidens TaxID=33524 RepID=A0ABV0TIN8_9TELE